MSCIKKIKSEEISGSTFRGREISMIGDITDYSFTAKVKSSFQGKITEILGVKNAGSVFFDFISLENLRNGKYIIEYWGDFGALGNEPFLLEELSIVSAENATNCTNSDNLNFEIKIEEISIPLTITKAINQFSLNIDNLTPEQIAQLKGDKGDKGEKGDTGLQGIQGIQGIQGEKGEKGDKGDTGATGLQGLQGIQGVKGDKGEKGEKGDAFTYADFTPTQIAQLQKPATDKVVELNALETTLNNSESLRVQNENSRVTAESARINAENTRATNETQRISNENDRKSAETSRVNAETNRVTAETSRASSETTRVNSENTRISNENTRISAENSRVTAESSRVTAENARVAAEIERQKATITVELISQLTTNFYAPNALRINSTALISGSGTLTLKVNDVAYTLGNLIPQGAKITTATTSSSVYNLISVYE